MATIRELIASFGIEYDPKGAKAANEGISSLVTNAKRLVTVLAAGKVVQQIDSFVKSSAALGDAIDKASQRIGVSAQALQELRFAGELGGVAIGQMDAALQTLTQNAATAARGGGAAREAFALLGIQLRDTGGNVKSADRLFQDITAGLGRVGDASEQARLAQQLFGGAGANLLPVLRQGRAALAQQRMEAQALGGVMDKRLIALSVKFTDAQTRLNTALRGVRNVIAKELLPRFIESTRGITAFLRRNREVIRSGLVEFLRRASTFVNRLRDAFMGAARAIFEFFKGLSPTTKRIVGLGAAVLAFAAVLALPLGPIALLIAGVLLLIDEFQTLGEGGRTVIGPLIEKLNDLVDILTAPIDPDDAAIIKVLKFATQVAGDLLDALNEIAGQKIFKGLEFIFSPEQAFKELLGLQDELAAAEEGLSQLQIRRAELEAQRAEQIRREQPAELPAPAEPTPALIERAAQGVQDLVAGNFRARADAFQQARANVVIPAATRAAGAQTSVMNAPETNIDVTVNAPGAASPQQIGSTTANAIAAGLEPVLRNTMEALTPAPS